MTFLQTIYDLYSEPSTTQSQMMNVFLCTEYTHIAIKQHDITTKNRVQMSIKDCLGDNVSLCALCPFICSLCLLRWFLDPLDVSTLPSRASSSDDCCPSPRFAIYPWSHLLSSTLLPPTNLMLVAIFSSTDLIIRSLDTANLSTRPL